MAAPAPPPELGGEPAPEEFLHLAQVVMLAMHRADLPSWCAVDLTMPQLKALFLAGTPGGASHGQIARALGVTLSTVTGVVDRLVEHGLVERHTDATDRRLSHVVATPAGVELVDRLWAGRRDLLARVLGALTPEERAALHATLTHLASLIGDYE